MPLKIHEPKRDNAPISSCTSQIVHYVYDGEHLYVSDDVSPGLS